MAVFLASSTITPRVFIYPFHTDFAVLDTYFQQNFRAAVSEFRFDLLVHSLTVDQEAGRDVVVLLSLPSLFVALAYSNYMRRCC